MNNDKASESAQVKHTLSVTIKELADILTSFDDAAYYNVIDSEEFAKGVIDNYEIKPTSDTGLSDEDIKRFAEWRKLHNRFDDLDDMQFQIFEYATKYERAALTTTI